MHRGGGPKNAWGVTGEVGMEICSFWHMYYMDKPYDIVVCPILLNDWYDYNKLYEILGQLFP